MPVQPHTLYTMHFLEVSSNLAYKALEAESHWYSCSQQDMEHNVGSVMYNQINNLYSKTTLQNTLRSHMPFLAPKTQVFKCCKRIV